MSFHQDRGGPRGGVPPGQHGTNQNYRPTNIRPPPPQPPVPSYRYDSQTAPYMPPHPDFMQYPPPVQSQTSNSLNQCPVRPPFSKPPTRQGFPEPPPNFPPPPLPGSAGGPAPRAQVSAQNAYHPYMMPPVPPPPLPHPDPPFPPPTFSSSYTQSNTQFQADHSIRHGGQYKYEKPMDSRRSPERGYRHDDHRRKCFGYGGHGDRHKMEFPGERKDRGRSPDRRSRQEGGRYRSEYDRGRTPPRHRSRDRSRERYRHRDSRRSQSPDRHRKRPRSRSTSRDRKRGRWEEERDRRSESSSGLSRERSFSAIRSRDSDEAFSDRDRERERERERDREREKVKEKGDDEKEEEDLLKPAWIRCTHAENYYSNDPMDQVGYDSSSDSDCESEGEGTTCSSSSDSEVFDVIAEIKRKKAHPDRLHEELWYNDPGEMNDGPLCKCSAKARRTGIRHSIYPGEEVTDRPTVIEYDDHEYLFEGFSLFSHTPLTNIPLCRVIRFNIDYTIHFIEEMAPENYCVRGLELFASYLFRDILELYDWNLTDPESDGEVSGCPRFHFMPRFVRFLPAPQKPSSVRIDQLDREQFNPDVITFPIIVHFGIRPAQLSYAGDPQYQKLWKSYVKLRHLLANSPKVRQIDKQKMTQREEALQKIRQKNTMRREVTVELSSQGFWKTGIRSDVCQHAMMLPVLTHHIRYHQCLMHLDKLIAYVFKERCLLQLSEKIQGAQVDLLQFLPSPCVRLLPISRINHNERLEFLGDAVVEFLTSVHLYYLFPSLEEGGLATYRTAIVQNQHLAMLAKKLELDRFMLYAHGPDLCRESDLRHAMANCFEALMGAVYLEGGLEEARQLFGRLLFNSEDLREVWLNYPPHPLQVQEPQTDRQLIETSPVLQKLTQFEESIGVLFTHVRLLARAFTLRTVGFNHLTLGHNQRMEFLGDSIMQLVATEYLFIHFPDHHEGHLTLLRSSLVNNRTQAKVAEELGMQEFAITNDKTKRPVALRTKTLADLLESFIAALYIDKDLEYVHTFMNVCFFPRLKEFILNQDWNDPKSQLQQCCLTLRTEGKEPDIPLYKTLQTVGPSHARIYTVAVYFKGERIGCGKGPSIQQAEMGAAMDALEKYNFPQMAHQKRFIERKYRQELKEMRRERERQEKETEDSEEYRK
ncbi:ribonuclease 3 [Neolamprologus brichardi]|uniref:ribonuclease 3 n=1 Tax=Neolamprologus brichardi TaxID=32507 RepID=UPI001643A9D3|nr:ribonuclease 3 [Neolamprologus brichardi]